jgi:hypothetical protein
MDKEKYNMFLLKYDNLAQDCLFEEIPHRYQEEETPSGGIVFALEVSSLSMDVG